MEENEVMEPQYGFWLVEITSEQEDESGKVKKVKEVHLIDGVDPTAVQQKCMDAMKGTMWDWSIVSCKKSKVNLIY